MSAAQELSAELAADPEMAWGWHCNIAMPIIDAIGCSHEDANKAAAYLMMHLFDVDITKDERFVYEKSGAQEYHEMRVAAERREDAAITADEPDTHALERTSPKGGPFFGTCFKCGAENLPEGAVFWPCPNPGNITGDEALLMAIDGPASVDGSPQGRDREDGRDARHDSAAPEGGDAQ